MKHQSASDPKELRRFLQERGRAIPEWLQPPKPMKKVGRVFRERSLFEGDQYISVYADKTGEKIGRYYQVEDSDLFIAARCAGDTWTSDFVFDCPEEAVLYIRGLTKGYRPAAGGGISLNCLGDVCESVPVQGNPDQTSLFG